MLKIVILALVPVTLAITAGSASADHNPGHTERQAYMQAALSEAGQYDGTPASENDPTDAFRITSDGDTTTISTPEGTTTYKTPEPGSDPIPNPDGASFPTTEEGMAAAKAASSKTEKAASSKTASSAKAKELPRTGGLDVSLLVAGVALVGLGLVIHQSSAHFGLTVVDVERDLRGKQS